MNQKTSKVEKEFYLRCSYLTLSVLFDKEPLFFNELFSANSLSGAICDYIISKEREGRKKKWFIQRLELLLKKAEIISFL
ncbi:hypothetical protein GBM58_15660 [Enterococcus faecium]|nr:hypothetical protein GBM58_15660 [Enterococcus faecium]